MFGVNKNILQLLIKSEPPRSRIPTIAQEKEQTGKRQEPDVAYFHSMCLLQPPYCQISSLFSSCFPLLSSLLKAPEASCRTWSSYDICFSPEVRFDHASMCEIPFVWNCHWNRNLHNSLLHKWRHKKLGCQPSPLSLVTCRFSATKKGRDSCEGMNLNLRCLRQFLMQ